MTTFSTALSPTTTTPATRQPSPQVEAGILVPTTERVRRTAVRGGGHLAVGADLVALSMALALGAAAHWATGGPSLTLLQENLAPVVVMVTWLAAIRMLGGYAAIGSGAFERVVVTVASGLAGVVLLLQWQATGLPTTATAFAVTLVSGTLLLLLGRWAVTSLLVALRP